MPRAEKKARTVCAASVQHASCERAACMLQAHIFAHRVFAHAYFGTKLACYMLAANYDEALYQQRKSERACVNDKQADPNRVPKRFCNGIKQYI